MKHWTLFVQMLRKIIRSCEVKHLTDQSNVYDLKEQASIMHRVFTPTLQRHDAKCDKTGDSCRTSKNKNSEISARGVSLEATKTVIHKCLSWHAK